jgi:hypothetical protein
MAERQPAHIEQALAEMAGTESEEQVKAARKRLDAAGYKQAAQARSEATAGDDGSRKAAPRGRTTRQEAKGSTT